MLMYVCSYFDQPYNKNPHNVQHTTTTFNMYKAFSKTYVV